MSCKKQLIINADDFGISKEVNKAVFEGFKNGLLTSATIMANAPAYEDALSYLPQMSNLSLGIHLNIIEFSTLNKMPSRKSLLYDKDGFYNNNFLELLFKSFNQKFLAELEEDFRLQIETVISAAEVDHIDSHVHVHAIPNIFKIVCNLAEEYKIKNIRTQFEYPYLVPDIKKYLSLKYPVNWIKLILLNTFSVINKKHLQKTNLSTNENFIGVNYTGYMDEATLMYALKNVKNRTEAVLHPSAATGCPYRYKEYLALFSEKLAKKINRLGIEPVNFEGLVKDLNDIIKSESA